jgi:hypothetical protein
MQTEEAMEEINSWVSDATKGLIPSILPPRSVHCLIRLVLANAIYLKGMWSVPFSATHTETRWFRRLDGSHVSAPFMTSWSSQAVEEGDGFKVLKLPYAPNEIGDSYTKPRFSMCVFLPDAVDGLQCLVDRMAATGPSSLWKDLPTMHVRVCLFLSIVHIQIHTHLKWGGTTGNSGFAECTRLCRGHFVGPSAELICAECRRRHRLTHGTTIFADGRTVGTARPSANRILCRGLALGTEQPVGEERTTVTFNCRTLCRRLDQGGRRQRVIPCQRPARC